MNILIHFNNFFKKRKNSINILGFSLVILIGIIDYFTGPEFAFSIFYLIPIFIITWYKEKWNGIIISIFATAIWLFAELAWKKDYVHPLVPYWNAIVGLGFFLIVTLLISILRDLLEQEKKMARTDFLTQTANIRSFLELANLEIHIAHRYKHPLTLAYIDIDNFKFVNDNFGHIAGNDLLCIASKTIKDNLRETDIVARVGGDEFVILLTETGVENAKVVINKIQKNLLNIMNKNNWPVTFSIGLATFLNPPNSIDKMIKEADRIMYSAKNNGKNMIKSEVIGEN
jgi:diguanylate cyclase (GGDEF)-like protein